MHCVVQAHFLLLPRCTADAHLMVASYIRAWRTTGRCWKVKWDTAVADTGRQRQAGVRVQRHITRVCHDTPCISPLLGAAAKAVCATYLRSLLQGRTGAVLPNAFGCEKQDVRCVEAGEVRVGTSKNGKQKKNVLASAATTQGLALTCRCRTPLFTWYLTTSSQRTRLRLQWCLRRGALLVLLSVSAVVRGGTPRDVMLPSVIVVCSC